MEPARRPPSTCGNFSSPVWLVTREIMELNGPSFIANCNKFPEPHFVTETISAMFMSFDDFPFQTSVFFPDCFFFWHGPKRNTSEHTETTKVVIKLFFFQKRGRNCESLRPWLISSQLEEVFEWPVQKFFCFSSDGPGFIGIYRDFIGFSSTGWCSSWIES